MDLSAAVIEGGRVSHQPIGLQPCFGRRETRIVMAAGTHSPRVLEEGLDHHVVANARKVLIYENDRRNDKLNAQMLGRFGQLDVSLRYLVRHRGAKTEEHVAVMCSRDARLPHGRG